ncbi:MAG: hypothetical protein ACRDIC_22235, partial [bacterium]
RKEEKTMKLTALAALAAILLATVPQALATEANLENIKLDADEAVYEPARVEEAIPPDQREPEMLEHDLRVAE